MKNKIPIIAAIILGLIVMVAINNHINNIKAEADAQLVGQPVWAAAVDIEKGEEIDESKLQVLSVPERFIPQQAMTTVAEMRQIEGRKARVAVHQDQILLWSDLEIQKRGGLSSLIPEGERAFSVETSAGVNLELLQLNDKVDIIGIFETKPEPVQGADQYGLAADAAGENNTVCVVLLQNVNILALGETIGDVYISPELAEGGQVTFSVTLPEAQLLMFASSQGDLALVLRREGEVQVLSRKELPRITMQDMERVTGEMDDDRKKRTIQVMRGRDVEEIQVETSDGPGAFE